MLKVEKNRKSDIVNSGIAKGLKYGAKRQSIKSGRCLEHPSSCVHH